MMPNTQAQALEVLRSEFRSWLNDNKLDVMTAVKSAVYEYAIDSDGKLPVTVVEQPVVNQPEFEVPMTVGEEPSPAPKRFRQHRSAEFPRACMAWTPDEDSTMKTLWPSLGNEKMSPLLGRTAPSIKKRAQELKLLRLES